jgi:hypothetical protein
MVGNEAEVETRNLADDGCPVLLVSPGGSSWSVHRRSRRTWSATAPGCYAMKGNRIAVFADRPQSAVEVPPPSVNSLEMAGVTVDHYPPGPAMASWPGARL